MGKENKATVGQLIDELFEVREQIRILNKQSESLGETKDAIELRLIAALEEQGVEQSRGARASATLSKQVVPQAVDWDKVYKFVTTNKMPYLFEKRLSATVYRDLLSGRNGKPIPGIESFERKTISLRTVN